MTKRKFGNGVNWPAAFKQVAVTQRLGAPNQKQ